MNTFKSGQVVVSQYTGAIVRIKCVNDIGSTFTGTRIGTDTNKKYPFQNTSVIGYHKDWAANNFIPYLKYHESLKIKII